MVLVDGRIVVGVPLHFRGPADGVAQDKADRAAHPARAARPARQVDFGDRSGRREVADVDDGDLGRAEAREAAVAVQRAEVGRDGLHRPDAGEHGDLIAVEEHLARPALDVELAFDGEALRRPARGAEQSVAGEDEDTRAVVLDEVGLVDPRDLRVGGRVGRRRAGGHWRGCGGAAGREHYTSGIPRLFLIELHAHLADGGVVDVLLQRGAAGGLLQLDVQLDIGRRLRVLALSAGEQGKDENDRAHERAPFPLKERRAGNSGKMKGAVARKSCSRSMEMW